MTHITKTNKAAVPSNYSTSGDYHLEYFNESYSRWDPLSYNNYPTSSGTTINYHYSVTIPANKDSVKVRLVPHFDWEDEGALFNPLGSGSPKDNIGEYANLQMTSITLAGNSNDLVWSSSQSSSAKTARVEIKDGAIIQITTDSNNDGKIDATDMLPSVKNNAPGKILRVNTDDDNKNLIIDSNEQNISGENDLVQFYYYVWVDLLGVTNNNNRYEIMLDNRNNALDFWQTATKTTRVKSAGTQLPPLGNIRLAILESGQKEVLGSFWAEGISASSFSQLLTAQHKSKSALNGSDSTYVSVISFGLQPYTPQTKYIAPMPIPETNWKANGVGIRRNGDYDCSNILSSNISDWGRSSANDNEDDLIRLDINITPCTGITYGLVSTSSTTDIKFWSSEKKGYGDAIIPNENSGMMKLLTNSTTFYAESSPYNTSSASYKLLAIDKNNKILFSEEITFRPFNSITIAFVGEFEQAGDPGVSPGINNWGINQLLNGYDVYVWDDGHDVFNSNTDCNKWGEGRSFDEVCNAINNRGVSNIAIIGYSHGGGSVYNLAWRMFYDGKTSDSNLYWYPPKKIQNSYNLVFTSYIDAVPNNSWIHGLLGTSVTVRPKGSNYHLNQFQENSIPNGCSIFTSNNEKNWTSVGLKHSNSDFLVSIDTNPEVQALLTQKFNEKITR